MIQSIEDYLAQLKKELAGCDRATIQDALSDAEEYLRMAVNVTGAPGSVSHEGALNEVIEKYGAPDEVAKAYRETESRLFPALAQDKSEKSEEEPERIGRKDERPFLKRFFGIYTEPGAWGAFLFLLFSLATGVIYFTWAVTGVSLSAGLLVLIIGLPFAGLFILSVRGIGLIEGLVIEALLGIRMPRRPLFFSKQMGWWLRLKTVVADRHTWFSLIYMVIKLPLGVFSFTVIIVLVALSLFLIALPVLQLGFDIPVGNINGVYYYLAGWALPLAVIAGILLATLTMHLARYLGYQYGRLAKALLVKF